MCSWPFGLDSMTPEAVICQINDGTPGHVHGCNNDAIYTNLVSTGFIIPLVGISDENKGAIDVIESCESFRESSP